MVQDAKPDELPALPAMKAPAVSRVESQEELAEHIKVRTEVFVGGKIVSAHLEVDSYDGNGHFDRIPPNVLHFNCRVNGTVAGTGRLILSDDGSRCKVQRIAITSPFRGLGVGTVVVKALHEEAARRGCSCCQLEAHVPAAPFYEKLGYTYMPGGVFIDDGIELVNMEHILQNEK